MSGQCSHTISVITCLTCYLCLLFTELIEMKSKGIFDLLDEESKLPTPKPDHFTMEVHNRNKEHFRLSVSLHKMDMKIAT